jgi:Tol biopolymer transport system component
VRAGGASLYFSSGPDIYVSRRGAGGGFGPAHAVSALNTAAMDIQPNVRKDGREILFASNRNPANGQDIWVATREDVSDPWSAPVNIGPAVNTNANETRPSLSWDGTTLYFGRAPLGSVADIFVTTRDRIPG